MSRLTGRVGRLRRSDRGGVTALVAVLLSSGVLLGMTAYAVDIGTLFAERSQLINGANSAAMAAAQECTRPGGTCGNPAQVQPLLNGNASDGRTALDALCGVDQKTHQLSACGTSTGATQCVAAPPSGTSYAEVHAGTQMSNGSTIYPPSFAEAAVPGYHGTHVRACSRVAWGPPQGPYAAFAISKCRFDQITGGMATPRAGGFNDPYPTKSPSSEVVINLEDWQVGNGQCGDFAYLDPTAGGCATYASPNGTLTGTVQRRNGTTPFPGQCQGLLDEPSASDPYPYVLIPIYTTVTVTNPDLGDATFSGIVGIAAFQITGAKLSPANGNGNGSGNAADWVQNVPPGQFCGNGNGNNQTRCVRGYFLFVDIIDGTMPASGWSQTLGVSAFKTVG